MESVGELGRFSEPALLILVSLVAAPKHGYAVREDVERLTGIRLGPGTLYGAVARLEERGLIEALAVQERRKPYRVTTAGSRFLATQLDALASVVHEGRRRLRAAGALA